MVRARHVNLPHLSTRELDQLATGRPPLSGGIWWPVPPPRYNGDDGLWPSSQRSGVDRLPPSPARLMTNCGHSKRVVQGSELAVREGDVVPEAVGEGGHR